MVNILSQKLKELYVPSQHVIASKRKRKQFLVKAVKGNNPDFLRQGPLQGGRRDPRTGARIAAGNEIIRKVTQTTMNEIYTSLYNALLDFLHEKKVSKAKAMGEAKDWIQGAVNPKHKGFCTPITKETCTPRRKALALRFKKAARKKKKKGGSGWQGKV